MFARWQLIQLCTCDKSFCLWWRWEARLSFLCSTAFPSFPCISSAHFKWVDLRHKRKTQAGKQDKQRHNEDKWDEPHVYLLANSGSLHGADTSKLSVSWFKKHTSNSGQIKYFLFLSFFKCNYSDYHLARGIFVQLKTTVINYMWLLQTHSTLQYPCGFL